MARVMTINWPAKASAFISAAILLGACTSDPGVRYAKERDAAIEKARAEKHHGLPYTTEHDSIQRVLRADTKAREGYRRLSSQQSRAAYREGVEDTMAEFRGRMNAVRTYVWQKPLVDVVEMPSRVVNGALVPGHMEPVLIAPGQWQERNGVALPDSPYGRGDNGRRR